MIIVLAVVGQFSYFLTQNQTTTWYYCYIKKEVRFKVTIYIVLIEDKTVDGSKMPNASLSLNLAITIYDIITGRNRIGSENFCWFHIAHLETLYRSNNLWKEEELVILITRCSSLNVALWKLNLLKLLKYVYVSVIIHKFICNRLVDYQIALNNLVCSTFRFVFKWIELYAL